MTTQAKKRIKRSGATLRRNLPKLEAEAGSTGKQTPANRAIRASVAKNLEALRILARE